MNALRTRARRQRPLRERVLRARDDWFCGASERAIEVSANASRTRWRIGLIDGGRVVGLGEGETWLIALAAALRAAAGN